MEKILICKFAIFVQNCETYSQKLKLLTYQFLFLIHPCGDWIFNLYIYKQGGLIFMLDVVRVVLIWEVALIKRNSG